MWTAVDFYDSINNDPSECFFLWAFAVNETAGCMPIVPISANFLWRCSITKHTADFICSLLCILSASARKMRGVTVLVSKSWCHDAGSCWRLRSAFFRFSFFGGKTSVIRDPYLAGSHRTFVTQNEKLKCLGKQRK